MVKSPQKPKATNPAAVLGSRGGKARAKKLSKAELADIGRKGARARWGEAKKPAKKK